jgi:2-ketocyclohexanecarboxyl-CoA hydrolase
MKKFEDILFTQENGVAEITINRPEVHNCFRPRTVLDIMEAFHIAGWNREIGAIVLTGAGGKAFCTGGDKSGEEHYGAGEIRGPVGLPVEEFHAIIRDVPKPVIAKVRGFAIGGGNVLATLCDMTIASENAVFGQVGPKMGSVDAGFGTAYLARVVGEKKAREFWYMCRRYTAQQALEMGLVNAVVPDDKLDAEVAEWCAELCERSPTAIALAKKSFNADTDSMKGISGLGMQALKLFYESEESREGINALSERRKPRFKDFAN